MSKVKNYPNEGMYRDRSSLVKIKINEELRSKIDKATQQLSKSYYPYDALCWALAEFELIFEKGHNNYSEYEVIDREKEIFDISLAYDDLCWFIANLRTYLEEVNLYP